MQEFTLFPTYSKVREHLHIMAVEAEQGAESAAVLGVVLGWSWGGLGAVWAVLAVLAVRAVWGVWAGWAVWAATCDCFSFRLCSGCFRLFELFVLLGALAVEM